MKDNMKKAAAMLTALTVVVVLESCRGKGKTAAAAAYPVKIETIEGVKTVLNPGFPKEGVVRYALQEDLTIGGEVGGAESVLNSPLYIKVDSMGNIYVMDWGDVEIKVFSPEGRLVRTIGKKGQGPGEFDTPAQFVLSADGRVFLLSGRQYQISILDRAGTYLSSFKVEGYCADLAVDSHNRVYYTEMLMPEPGAGAQARLLQNKKALFRTDEKGQERTRLGEYLDVTMLQKVISGNKEGGIVQTLTSGDSYTTSWLVGPDDRVYLGYNKNYLLDVYGPDWKLLFRFGREFTPVRHPQFLPDGANPEFFPAFSDYRKFFDDQGDLWLEQYVEEGVKDHVFDIFSPDGIYLRQVRVPQTLYLVRGDKAYSIIRAEDEFLVVKRFRLLPEEK